MVLAIVFVITVSFQILSDFNILSVFQAFLSYVLSLVPMFVFITTAALLSVVLPTPSLSMFLSILIYGILMLISLLWGSVGAVLFTSYTSWYKMWMGSGFLPSIQVLPTLGLLLSESLIFFTTGFLLFDKKTV
jgi:hypothetical protein